MILDIIIIGSGPAGLSAAIYANRAGLNFIVIEKTGISGGQMLSTYDIDNYPGLPGVSGMELGDKMREHADKLGVKFVTDEINAITSDGDMYILHGDESDYQAKGVVIATGADHAKLGIDGEEELLGMGVSYCATCDGAFFAGRDVAVVGGGDVALEDALFLAKSCNMVYLIHRRDEFRAVKTLQKAVEETPNIKVIFDSEVTAIKGTDQVESITVFNKKEKVRSSLSVNGIFIAVGITPESKNFVTNVTVNKGGYIEAGEDCRTSMPRIYAVGDVRAKRLRQIVTAVADGANAIRSFQDDII